MGDMFSNGYFWGIAIFFCFAAWKFGDDWLRSNNSEPKDGDEE